MRIFIWFKLYHICDKVKSAMIDKDKILETVPGAALWCGAEYDSNDLAYATSVAIEQHISDISVVPVSVPVVWPWVENKNIKIFSRFYLTGHASEDVSEITEKVNASFKQGANGAQIFLSLDDLDDFVSQLYLIRDDLFFNKSMIIGMDISEIGPFEWSHVFSMMNKVRATGLMLALTKDTGNDSDFVGRVYAALNALEYDNLELQFMLGQNKDRMEQVYRLVKSMKPQLLPNLKFFINA